MYVKTSVWEIKRYIIGIEILFQNCYNSLLTNNEVLKCVNSMIEVWFGLVKED